MDATLAYVFWHWRQPQVPAAEYERRQRDFHAALAAHPPDGFSHSASSALTGAPWANGGAEAYQDRYLIADSCALDALDRAVVGGAQRAAHDRAAGAAASGVGGLYRARLGAALPAPRHAQWFGKPRTSSYDDLLARFEPLVRPHESVLWMRRLVLGPTPEFCVESTKPFEIPSDLEPLALSLRPVWPLQSPAAS
jgi:hypothetical protein